MGSQARRERERRSMEEEIIATALAMVRAEGAANLSLRRVAEQMEYSSAALYRYFPDKAALVGVLCDRGFAELAARLEAVPADLPAGERLLALGEAYLRFAAEEPHLYTLMFVDMLPGPAGQDGPSDPRQFLSSPAFAILHQAVAGGGGDRLGRSPDVVLPAAISAWALVHGFAMLRVRFPRALDDDFIRRSLRAAGPPTFPTHPPVA